ncbi:alpha/beta fold hydrolase [Dermatobacter hominis]|uniref:alpha/beta fold hydrolase n=1 Tax=Dermatobacter hominis TaxID=2884263 RepID=UPI001D1006CC|nr:alpha/beta hydrolase [Dermatobacter hominis]UDY36123.1 alpha/beta hydrolase [Dermatobacter hominis]
MATGGASSWSRRARRRDDGSELCFRTVHGYQRAYRMAGSGPPILLIHGIGDESSSWMPVLPALAERHTVIAPDLLGHGSSDKPRADYSVAAFSNGMRDLLDVLDVDRVTVVGHSLGGGVAAQLAYQYPERVERLVLIGTGGVGREVSPVLRAAAAPLSELGMAPLMVPGANEVVGAVLGVLGRLGLDIGRDAGEVARVLRGMPDRRQRAAFGRTLRAVVDRRGQLVTMLDRAYLAESMPVLLAWGDHDGIIPVEHAQRAHEAMPGSRLSIYEGAGHFPHHADPDRFVAELNAFVDETRPYLSDRRARRRLLLQGPGGVAVDEPEEPALLG